MSSPGSNADDQLPAVDERLVAPGTRYEIDDGKLVYVPPSDPPHAICNANLAWLLQAHVAPEFQVAVDMLTRTSKIDDIAPDASVFPRAPHPQTGGRQLEQIAFEVASTQSLADAGRKAGKLATRGVRRVFAIDLERTRVLEWSRPLETWSILDSTTSIEDPVFAVPIPIEALLQTISADDAVATALLARQQRIILAHLQAATEQGELRGELSGRIHALFVILAARGLVPSAAQRDQISRERELERLDRWIVGAGVCTNVDELLAS